MPERFRVTVVSGGLQVPSKTDSLLAAIADALTQVVPAEISTVRLSSLLPALGQVVRRDQAPANVASAIDAIEATDLLIVGTPVFRGSYSGLFKHLFDLVHQDALIGKPVLLAATGGSERHALVLEHQLRPLFAFFQTLTLPIGVYGTDRDFTAYQVSSDALRERIALTVELARPWLRQAIATQPAAQRATLRAA